MRVRKDPTGWHARGVKKRDARHTKSSDEHRPVAGKKDTKRWCGGKVGREHKPVCMNYSDLKGRFIGTVLLFKGWKVFACTVCGKELDHWWPSGLQKRTKPDWVTS